MPRLFLLGIEIGNAILGASRSQSMCRAMRDVISGFPSLMQLLNATSTSTSWKEPLRYCPELMHFEPTPLPEPIPPPEPPRASGGL